MGRAPRGLRPPTSNSAETFVQRTYPQVSSSYVYSFGSYRVDKQTNPQTNKQTPLKASNALHYATTLSIHFKMIFYFTCKHGFTYKSQIYRSRLYFRQWNITAWSGGLYKTEPGAWRIAPPQSLLNRLWPTIVAWRQQTRTIQRLGGWCTRPSERDAAQPARLPRSELTDGDSARQSRRRIDALTI